MPFPYRLRQWRGLLSTVSVPSSISFQCVYGTYVASLQSIMNRRKAKTREQRLYSYDILKFPQLYYFVVVDERRATRLSNSRIALLPILDDACLDFNHNKEPSITLIHYLSLARLQTLSSSVTAKLAPHYSTTFPPSLARFITTRRLQKTSLLTHFSVASRFIYVPL
jgi:hypothetical protein